MENQSSISDVATSCPEFCQPVPSMSYG